MRSTQPSLAPDDLAVPDSTRPKKFVIGLDYGTTFTSVSYSIHPIDEEVLRAFAWDVKSITNWPNASNPSSKQVPTESWYSESPIDRTIPGGLGIFQMNGTGDQADDQERVRASIVRP